MSDSDELLRILQGVEPDLEFDFETKSSYTSEEDDNESMHWPIVLLAVTSSIVCADAQCPYPLLSSLPLVVEYGVWRGWQQAIIHTPGVSHDCKWAMTRLVKCLGVNGIASALNTKGESRINKYLAVVIVSPKLKNNTENITQLLKQFSEYQLNTASYDWFIATQSSEDFKFMNGVLNLTSVRFDQNIIVAYPHHSMRNKKNGLLNLCDSNFSYKKGQKPDHRRSKHYYNCPDCTKTEFEFNYYRASERFKNLTRHKILNYAGRQVPLFQAGILGYNQTGTFEMLNISAFSLKHQFRQWRLAIGSGDTTTGIHLVQYFKVRINSTLYARYLGNWLLTGSMSQVKVPYPTESRNFLGEKLIVGRSNQTGEDVSIDDDDPSAELLLNDVLHLFSVHLNATAEYRYYSKLGFRTYEGTWTGLLGGLMDLSVDIALEPVTIHAPLDQYINFLFPIAETMCNIYIRQQETSTVRDIFLAPFSPRLLACVISVPLVASLTIVLISKLSPAMRAQGSARPMGYTEALMWSTGILCQQGGTWTTTGPAASILLIVCLFFAVVIYNAYAAFITSVLSVRVASVDTIAAVLNSPNFKIGYIKNSADQMYLMTTTDAQLNAFYIRGYSDAENLVTSAEEGLERAAKQDYAFFAGQRAARTAWRYLSQARGRCALRELQVPSTRAQLAFPLPLRSAYARPTLISLLELRSSGTLTRLEKALVPNMPQCEHPQGFASARAADVRSALILLVVGLIMALLLVMEFFSSNPSFVSAEIKGVKLLKYCGIFLEES